MFYNDLFTIKSQKIEAQHATFTIMLNLGHSIYKGHFPGDGITPGVCILQIACDLFSIAQQKSFVISSMKSVKFLQLIRPSETPEITYDLSYQPVGDNGDFETKCIVSHEETTLTKSNLTLSLKTSFL